MKKLIYVGLIGGGLLLSTPSWAVDSQFPCDKPIVEAVTADGKKEVRICISGNAVSYTFGRVDKYDAELDIRVPTQKTGYNYYGGIATFEVKRGNYAYTFIDGGTLGARLTVNNGRRELADIAFGKVFTNNIYDMDRFGIRDVGF